jgi:hypothetical protein
MTQRVHPPVGGAKVVLFGTTYSATEGSPIDVPDNVAQILVQNGWVGADAGSSNTTVGATAARPTNPTKNTKFLDATLGYVIMFDGKTWRNPATGAAV